MFLSTIVLFLKTLGQDFPSALALRECIELDLSESVQKENNHFVYKWTFGDGDESYGIIANHCYDSIGTFVATLSIMDPISSKEFEEEYSETIDIIPAVELIVSLENIKNNFQGKAELIGYEASEAMFYWSSSSGYDVGQIAENLLLSKGDTVRVLSTFDFKGEETFLSKQLIVGQ